MTKWVILIVCLLVVFVLCGTLHRPQALRLEEATEKFKLPNSPPAFYINLSRDIENRARTERTLGKVLPRLQRVPGILHPVGREGCRQAHVAAQRAGLQATQPGQYYIVLEDDAKLNVDSATFSRAIEEAQASGADLILLNIQNYPRDVLMRKTNNPSFYRLFGGVGSGLSYMVRHEFGQRLIEHWNKHPFEHIDVTWQALWPQNLVLVHNPLLFLHHVGPSTTGDTLWRTNNDPVTQNFEWNKVKLM